MSGPKTIVQHGLLLEDLFSNSPPGLGNDQIKWMRRRHK